MSDLRKVDSAPLLGSGLILMINTLVANLAGYGASWLVARQLSLEAVADFNLLTAFQASLTFLTLALMLTVTRYAAIKVVQHEPAQVLAMRHWLYTRSTITGFLMLLALILGAPLFDRLFQIQSAWPFVLLAVGMPVFLLSAVERGILQGLLRFDLYALSVQVEVWVKLVSFIAAVLLKWGANEFAAILSLSVIFGWLTAYRTTSILLKANKRLPFTEVALLMRTFIPLLVIYGSQIVINNSDLLLVKAYYSPLDAGRYAGLVLAGRVIFYGTWSISLTIFPIVARRHANHEPHIRLLYSALLLVGGMVFGATLIASIFSTQLIGLFLGAQYLTIAPLLGLYAFATSLYSVANVVVNYYTALDNTSGNYLVFIAGALQIVGIILFHATMTEVVLVQVVVMGLLLAALLIWHVDTRRKASITGSLIASESVVDLAAG